MNTVFASIAKVWKKEENDVSKSIDIDIEDGLINESPNNGDTREELVSKIVGFVFQVDSILKLLLEQIDVETGCSDTERLCDEYLDSLDKIQDICIRKAKSIS
jgi:hypothetical protein